MSITSRFIVICERAFTAAGTNNLSLINIFTQINANQFPFVHPQFAVVVNFDTTETGAHTLRIRVTGPDRNQVAQSDLPVTTHANNWQVIANYEHFTFAAPGTYTFAVEMEGVALGERSLQVVKVGDARKTAVA
ncbi:MAG TPA: hypothetical protein VJ553_05190 [Candidatus Paceibacterota bacterium]|nr:hypothetical protein [Candidatus Paceibacterota bacterium]